MMDVWGYNLVLVCIIFILHGTKAQDCRGVTEWDVSGQSGSLSVGINYGPGYLCHWKLTAPAGMVIRLTFSHLSLSVHPYCGADLLSVFDHNGAPLRDLCGVWGNPPTLVSGSNFMSILFTSDMTETSGKGFSATWKLERYASVHCRTTSYLSTSSGVLRSTSIGDNYANSASCCWSIIVSGAESIALTFDLLDLEPQVTCQSDWVKVFGGVNSQGPLRATRCNNRDRSVVVSAGENMFVCFKSDAKSVRTGFKASYRAMMAKITTPTTTTSTATPRTTMSIITGGNVLGENICDAPHLYERFFIASGTISTALGVYRNGLQCFWDIIAPTGKIVVITLKRFALETTADCSGDFLHIIDINYGTVRKDCGTMSNLPRKISGGHGWVRLWFHSDTVDNAATGFYAEWSATTYESILCKGTKEIGGVSGTISSSEGDYVNRANCRWKITAPDNMIVKLTIDRLDIENSFDCYKDKLRIYDAASPDRTRLVATLCNSSTTTTFEYSSTGRHMYLVFSSNNDFVGAGFNATYKYVTSQTAVTMQRTTWLPPMTTPLTERCGSRTALTRIVGGVEASPNSWPWMVSVRDVRGNHIAGGSLVGNRWVLTAAHAVSYWRTPFGYKAVMGLHKQGDTGVPRDISHVYTHPGFVSHAEYYENDVALLRLMSSVTYTSSVRPICLPSDPLPIRHECKVTGWGEVDPGTQRTSNVLLEARAPIEHDYYCDYYHTGKFNKTNMLCAGYYDGYTTACNGDNGGPLACGVSDVYFLHGVISYNTGCGTYGVFTRVAAFTDWIKEKMEANP